MIRRKRYAMVIETRKCVACMACVAACWAENNVPLGYYRTWIDEIGPKGEPPFMHMTFRPEQCNHCENPPCVRVCPSGAAYKREEDGIVLVREERCIGCKICIGACPYDARYINPEKGVINKCTFCIHRVLKGMEPACVATCPTGARHFGDLNDPNSEVSKLVNTHETYVLKEELGTGPNVIYIPG